MPSDQLAEFLAPGTVTIELPANTALMPQAQLLFAFAVNLLARLYPVVQRLEITLPPATPILFEPPRWVAPSLEQHVVALLKALRPPVRWVIGNAPSERRNCTLVIGTATRTGEQTVFAGSDGWIARISAAAPVLTSPEPNPIGAYAAACLATSEVCKRLLVPHRDLFPGVPIVPSEDPLSFSAFTYRVDEQGPNPPFPARLHLGRLTLVGVGAGGGSFAHTLASARQLTGAMTVIEPDVVTDTNLNRLVMADAEDVATKRQKAAIVKPLFWASPELGVRPLAMPYARAASVLQPEDYRYVVAAVHSREARRQLQYETPMVIWDAAATDHGDFYVWRMVLGTTLCMHCKHPIGTDDPEQQQAQQLATLLGLDVPSWLRKVRDNEPFTLEEVGRISAHVGRAVRDYALPEAGQHFGDWFAEQCGRLKLPALDEEVPIPFAPVIAGVLLAGEVIKERLFPAHVLDSCYWNTLLGRFMRRNVPHRRVLRADCPFCHDPTYLRQYARRWA
jgi:molybdopterin/thiamine biosynthesis adenylyltransferase